MIMPLPAQTTRHRATDGTRFLIELTALSYRRPAATTIPGPAARIVFSLTEVFAGFRLAGRYGKLPGPRYRTWDLPGVSEASGGRLR